MDPDEATGANAQLWSSYLRDPWARALPAGERNGWPSSEIADGVAATVAVLGSLSSEALIGWLYEANAKRLRPDAAPTASQ